MVVADDLAPIRRQAICKQHDDEGRSCDKCPGVKILNVDHCVDDDNDRDDDNGI